MNVKRRFLGGSRWDRAKGRDDRMVNVIKVLHMRHENRIIKPIKVVKNWGGG
jgi:hypothetical protein